MIRLYLTPVPEQTSEDAANRIGSQVQQAGLLEGGGTAVENVSTENVDYQKAGRIQYGPTLTRKVAEELDSLSESAYTGLPLYDASDASLGRKRGYYEIERIDVTPAQEARDDVYEYDVRLTNAGTREDSRRSVATNPTDIDSVYPDATTPALIAIPDAATDVRWYDDAEGTEPATATATAESEYGTVARYDPADSSFTSPTLTYDLAFEHDGPTDVRVYDSRDRVKFAATASGGEVNTWIHAYHEGYQFDGAAVIDTGRFRLILNGALQVATGYGTPIDPLTVESGETVTIATGETDMGSNLVVEDDGSFVVQDGASHMLTGTDTTHNPQSVGIGETVTIADGETERDTTLTVNLGGDFNVNLGGYHILTGGIRSDVVAQRWDTVDDTWRNVTLNTTTDWTLASWSLSQIRPARVGLDTLWADGTKEARLRATFERGSDTLVWEVPENATDPPQELVDVLNVTARDTDMAAHATQGLIDRSKLDE